MKIHWYWPFARPEELAWAESTCTESDTMVVQVIDRRVAPAASTTKRVTVVRDLPDVDRASVGRVRWLLSRISTYVARWQTRSKSWAALAPDVAHIHYLNRFTDLWWGRSRPPVLVLSVHDVLPHITRIPLRLEKLILNRIYRSADGLIVHHASLRRRLLDEFGIEPSRVHVIGHQVFPVAPELTSENPPDGPPVVMFFGAMRANKGVSVLCEAIEEIGGGRDISFHFAGRGDADIESQLSSFAASHMNVTAEVGFVEYDRKAELFRSASIIVLPYTDFSSQSGVLHDAYGHSRPVVVTDVGALGETVHEDGTGVVVAPSDPLALAAAIEALLDDAEAMSKMQAAAARVTSERSPKILGQELAALYVSLAESARPAS